MQAVKSKQVYVISKTPELTWEELIELPTLETALAHVAKEYNFSKHPYFIWMNDQTTTRDAFRQSQLPFRFAVESFSQALAAVLARVQFLEARLPLFANIAEEHGYGNPLRSHKFTFREYLLALGVSEVELNTPCITPILAFNQSILTYCLTQNPEAGAAMLCIIEYLYVGISASIASTLKKRVWTLPGSQSHYTTHEKLDSEHATDLMNVATPAWKEMVSRPQVARSLVLGAHYFWSLYNDLCPTL